MPNQPKIVKEGHFELVWEEHCLIGHVPLNLDFQERRKFVEQTPKTLRPAKVIEKYSCFKDANEVSCFQIYMRLGYTCI